MTALDLIGAIDPRLTIYYCIDDLARSSPGARKIVTSEEKLFKQADLVFVTSEKLRQRAAGFRPDVHLFPFGVSFERFERVRNSGVAVPADIAALPSGLTVAVRQFLSRAPGLVPESRRRLGLELLHAVLPHVSPPPPGGFHP